jgi:ATP-dependent RNA helicase RhlE
LFSATFDAQIKGLTHQFLKDPAVIEISPSSSATSANVTQMAYPVAQTQKKALLQALLELGNMTSALIFTRTKHGADKLHRTLMDLGKTSAVIHSNRSLSQRQSALQGFKDKRYKILVATDIAARGIDVKNISHVINYDVPRHPEDYVHRIGRTGRAEAVGEAFTLVAPDEMPFLKKIESFIKKPIPRGVIPDFPYHSKPVLTADSDGSGGGRVSQPPHGSGRNRPRFGGGNNRQRFAQPNRSHSSSHGGNAGSGGAQRGNHAPSQGGQGPSRGHQSPSHGGAPQTPAPKKRWDWRRHR